MELRGDRFEELSRNRRAWSQARKSHGLSGKHRANEGVEARGERPRMEGVKQVTHLLVKGWDSVVKHLSLMLKAAEIKSKPHTFFRADSSADKVFAYKDMR